MKERGAVQILHVAPRLLDRAQRLFSLGRDASEARTNNELLL
jgi:hypothetical protein